MFAYFFYLLPFLQQRPLVFHLVPSGPCLDLIAKSLELLDLSLQIVFELVFLCSVCRRVDFLVDAIEGLYPLRDLFEGFVDFLLSLPRSHGCNSWGATGVCEVGVSGTNLVLS